MDLTLARVAAVWRRLRSADPRRLGFTIVIAGTNGKGSSLSMLEAILRHCGHKTGAFTSPHLVHFNERIKINGKAVASAQICTALAIIEAARRDLSLTYFEYCTLCALVIFQQQQVAVSLLEVGLGGRRDAVNIIANDIALLTAIGLDHQAWLGTTREQIAHEKAGIIKPRGVAVCADADTPISVLQAAQTQRAELLCAARDFTLTTTDDRGHWRSDHKVIPAPWRELEFPLPSLAGAHQQDNLRGVLAVLALASQPLAVTPADVCAGLTTSGLAARCHIYARAPLTIIDVAHNADSAVALAQFLATQRVVGKTFAIFGVLADKPVAAIVAPLAAMVDHWLLAGVGGARGQDARQLAEKLSAMANPVRAVNPFANPVLAYQHAISQAHAADRIVVFGSFHTAGAIIAHLDDD